MFRRLFAIETAALQIRDDEVSLREEQPAHPFGESFRDLSRYTAIPSRYGMWSSRTSI